MLDRIKQRMSLMRGGLDETETLISTNQSSDAIFGSEEATMLNLEDLFKNVLDDDRN